jgi:adenosine deaminase
MALRGLSRFDLMKHLIGDDTSQHESLNDYWREEVALVQLACNDQPEAIKLLWQWLSDAEVQNRANELISKNAAFLDAPSYVRLQQALMSKVAERGVLIETLPSSNVRISQYSHIGEHHSLRWMRIPGYIEEGDPEIMVCLGSDDPGIFAADLETEFYLLYTTLRAAGLSDSDALSRLRILNERGRVYRFHHPEVM